MHGRFDTRAWLRSIAVLMLVTTTLVVPVTSASAETTVTLTGAQANEGDSGSSTFTFSLSVTGGFAGTIEGTYRTRGAGEPTPGPDPATATPGVDYRSTSGTFSFTASGDEQLIDVTVFGDKEIEPHEIFYIEVRSDRLEGGLASIGRILNDDIRSISINDVTVVEGDTGSPTVEFTVRLSHVSTETVTFQYATCGNYCDGEATAVEHSDFKADTGTLTIEPGRVIRKLRVALIADTELEPDETFFVIIFNPVNAALGDREGVGTIVNDDTEAPTRLALATTAIFEGDSGTTSAVFTVSASPAPTEMVTVEFTPCGVGCSVDATASPGDDFIHAWQTITFQPGQTVKTVSVAVVGDKVAEEDEVFFGYLLNPVNARVDVNKAVVTILDDDTPNRPPACGGKRATLWGEGLLVGTAGDDVIVGGPGSDELKGLGGDDTLCGGGGDDTLVGGPGHDTMFGDAGNDLIKGLVGDDVAYGGPGDDRIQGNSGRDKLSGGDGKDKLWGGIHNDRLDGGADNDQLRGGGGGDTLIGGPGTDRVWGDAGNDIIDGGDNSDVLYGGIGADMIWGGKGNDRIFGWDGNDLLFGGPGRDQLRGQAGDDLVDGGPSNDFCSEESTMVSCEQIL